MIYNNGYVTLQGYECLNACIRNYLHYFEIPITGSDIFLSGKDLSVRYLKRGDDRKIQVDVYQSNFEFLRKANLYYEHDFFSFSKDFISFIEGVVAKEFCLSIRTISDYLVYNKAFAQTEGVPHYVNVIGIDKENKKIFLSDGDVPTFKPSCFEGWVDLDAIMEAWYGMRGEYIILYPEKSKCHWEKIKEEGVIKLKNMMNDYLSGRCHKRFLRKEITGQQAVLCLFEELEELVKRRNRGIEEVALDVNYQLRIHGFLISKRYIYDMLKEIHFEGKLFEQYGEMVEKWNAIFMFLIKAGKSKRVEDFKKLNDRVKELCRMEEKVMVNVMECL